MAWLARCCCAWTPTRWAAAGQANGLGPLGGQGRRAWPCRWAQGRALRKRRSACWPGKKDALVQTLSSCSREPSETKNSESVGGGGSGGDGEAELRALLMRAMQNSIFLVIARQMLISTWRRPTAGRLRNQIRLIQAVDEDGDHAHDDGDVSGGSEAAVVDLASVADRGRGRAQGAAAALPAHPQTGGHGRVAARKSRGEAGGARAAKRKRAAAKERLRDREELVLQLQPAVQLCKSGNQADEGPAKRRQDRGEE